MAKVIEKGPRMAPKMLPMRALKGIKNGAQEQHAKITVLWPPGRLLGDSWALFGAPKSEVGFATFFALEQRSCSWPSWDLFVASLVPSCGNFGSFSGHPGSKTAAIQQQYSSNTAANQQQTSSNTAANQQQTNSKTAAHQQPTSSNPAATQQ